MIGDLVNTSGAVYQLVTHFPTTQFVLEGGRPVLELYNGFPRNLEVWTRDRHLGLGGKLKQTLRYRSGNFNWAISLDDSREKLRLATSAGIRRVVGVTKKHGTIGNAEVLPFRREGHDLFDTLETVLKHLKVEPNVAPRLFPSARDIRSMEGVALPSRAIGLHIDASDLSKEWPSARWIELGRDLVDHGFNPIVLSGPDEADARHEIAAKIGVPWITQRLTLLEYACLVQRLDTLIVADTGPAHIAAAMGTRTVVLYGPTDPRRFHPYGNRWTAIRKQTGCEHYGVGCIHRSEGYCSQSCMRAISADDVRDALAATMKR